MAYRKKITKKSKPIISDLGPAEQELLDKWIEQNPNGFKLTEKENQRHALQKKNT